MGRKDVLPWQQAGGERAPEAAIAAAVWGLGRCLGAAHFLLVDQRARRRHQRCQGWAGWRDESRREPVHHVNSE